MMELRLENGLLLVSCTIKYRGKTTILGNVLLDTGCAKSIFDIDIMENIGLCPDPKTAKIVKMYGIGGKSEACLEQDVHDLMIGGHYYQHFQIQLGPINSEYGFDAILGNDFLRAGGLTIDLAHLVIYEQISSDFQYLH